MRTIEGIKSILKLKDDKSEPPDIYLGAFLEQVETQGGTKCDKYTVVLQLLGASCSS